MKITKNRKSLLIKSMITVKPTLLPLVRYRVPRSDADPMSDSEASDPRDSPQASAMKRALRRIASREAEYEVDLQVRKRQRKIDFMQAHEDMRRQFFLGACSAAAAWDASRGILPRPCPVLLCAQCAPLLVYKPASSNDDGGGKAADKGEG